MKQEIIKLCPNKPGVTLTSYLFEHKNNKAPAMLVLPGGGYAGICADREGEPIAVAFSALGFKCFVLHYSVGAAAKFPAPLVEASLAMHYIKANAAKYGIDPERVFVVGFSAGGHLAGALGTMWHKVWREEKLDMPEGANRPCGMILSYPVACYFEGTHLETFGNAIGKESFTEDEAARVSLDKQVDADTVPAFLWHTVDDELVSVENTLRLASALCRQGVYTELHVFPHGPHGEATANEVTCGFGLGECDARIERWPQLVREWAKTVK